MDLTIDFPEKENINRLNLRVVILAKTKNGYIFEKHSLGYLYCMGGRIKLNESSFDAAKRETFEEINLETNNFKFKCIVENFYTQNNYIVQEINFVYEIAEILNVDLTENFVEVGSEELEKVIIKPEILKQVIKDLEANNLKSNYTIKYN